MKGRTIMGSYLNIHLNLFPIYVLLLLLALSHGRPSARVKEHSQFQQPYQVQKIVEIYNQISLRNSGDEYYVDTEKNELGQNGSGDTDSQHGVAHYPRNKNQTLLVHKYDEDDPNGPPHEKSKHNPDFQSFLNMNMNMDTQDEEEEDSTQASILQKFRVKILNELGFNVSNMSNKTIPKPEISKEEYIRVYTEYMTNVKNRRARERNIMGAKDRRKMAISRVQTFDDCATEKAESVGQDLLRRSLKFDFHLSPEDGKQYRIRRALLQLPAGCTLPDESLNLNTTLDFGNSSEERFAEEEEEEGGNDEDVNREKNVVDVTRRVSLWMVQHESSPFVVEATCSRRSVQSEGTTNSTASTNFLWPAEGSKLKVLTQERSSRRFRRSLQKSTLNSFTNPKKYDGRDCSNTRHGKSCCRKSLKVKFSDLGISDEIMEPKEFDAHVCEGRCNARRVAYSSTHAMFQHILHQAKGKAFAPRPCCTPTKLTQLDVIIIDPSSSPSKGATLHVVNLNNAIVIECGCS